MKKAIAYFVLLVVFASGALYAETDSLLKLDKASKTGLVISSKTVAGFSGFTSIGSIGLSDCQRPEGLFTSLEIEGYSKNYGKEGLPHLPVLSRLIEIPFGASVRIIIKGYDTEQFSLAKKGKNNHLAPMQPSAPKNIPADKVKFYYNSESYKVNAFNTDPPVIFEDIGIMRGVRIGRLKIAPLRYNPFQNIVKIMNNISFDVVFDNAETVLTEKIKQKYSSPLFKASLNLVEKLPEVNASSKDAIADLAEWPLSYIIVAHASFKGNTSLDAFIKWKRQSGFNVIDVYTDDSAIGSTKTSIKAYLENLYKNSNTIPSYVLLIGDVDKIPAWSGNTGSHVTDLYYFTYDGSSDYIPDLYYGRFPADTNAELSAIISKTLQYEKYDFDSDTEADYLNNYMFVAGADSDYAPSYGNAQLNYLTKEYFSENPDSEIYKYLYPDSSGITNAIIENFNSGVGFVNYTGHCGADGWYNGVSYDFQSDDFYRLSNENKYGFLIANCCLSNKFDDNDCFGENILKEENAGAVAYIGASDFTYWDEDFYWSVGEPDLELKALNASEHTISNTEYGAYDGLFHKAKAQTDWYITAGQIIHCGNLAVMNSASPNHQYYWEVYHLMGDPSLMPYLEEPLAFSASPVISQITSCLTTAMTISDLEENSYLAFSQNGVLLDSAYSGSNTFVGLNFAAIDSKNGDGMIVITKQNKKPYINDTITIIQASSVDSPVADFTSSAVEIYSGAGIDFNNLSTGCGNTYIWDLEGSLVVRSSENNPTVIYKEIGIFTVILEAINAGGSDFKTESDYIKVLPEIKANSTKNIIKEGKCEIEFSELSVNHGDITLWEWKFPEGNPAMSQDTNPLVEYTTPGSYKASLDLIVNDDVYSSRLLNIKIMKALPLASFTINPELIIAGEPVYFCDKSKNDIDTIEWKFVGGTPKFSNVQNPVVVYAIPGTYSVTLTVFNTTGFDRKQAMVIINQAAETPPDSDNGGGGTCFIQTSEDVF